MVYMAKRLRGQEREAYNLMRHVRVRWTTLMLLLKLRRFERSVAHSVLQQYYNKWPYPVLTGLYTSAQIFSINMKDMHQLQVSELFDRRAICRKADVARCRIAKLSPISTIPKSPVATSPRIFLEIPSEKLQQARQYLERGRPGSRGRARSYCIKVSSEQCACISALVTVVAVLHSHFQLLKLSGVRSSLILSTEVAACSASLLSVVNTCIQIEDDATLLFEAATPNCKVISEQVALVTALTVVACISRAELKSKTLKIFAGQSACSVALLAVTIAVSDAGPFLKVLTTVTSVLVLRPEDRDDCSHSTTTDIESLTSMKAVISPSEFRRNIDCDDEIPVPRAIVRVASAPIAPSTQRSSCGQKPTSLGGNSVSSSLKPHVTNESVLSVQSEDAFWRSQYTQTIPRLSGDKYHTISSRRTRSFSCQSQSSSIVSNDGRFTKLSETSSMQPRISNDGCGTKRSLGFTSGCCTPLSEDLVLSYSDTDALRQPDERGSNHSVE